MAADGTIQIDVDLDQKNAEKSMMKLSDVIKGSAIFGIIQKAMSAISQSIGDAVSRFDTLNNFPRVLEQMGFGANKAAEATKKLSDGVQGLPTTLDSVVAVAQRLAVTTGDLDKSVETTLAMNNAMLASGTNAANASRGLEQYIQMLSAGKVDMQSWRTLQETMGLALRQTAEAFGYAGQSAVNDLYAALSDGEITFDQFNSKIIELSNSVGGFAELAKTSTGGIGTAWANFSTAIVRGVTEMIRQIDAGLASANLPSIQKSIEAAGKVAFNVLSKVGKAIPPVIKAIKDFSPAILAAAAGMVVYRVATTVATGAIGKFAAGESMAATAVFMLSAAKKGDLAATIADTVATSGMTVAQTAQAAIMGVLTGKIGLATAAQWLWNAAMSENPIGIAIIAAVALVAAITAVSLAVKALNPELEEQTQKTKELEESHKELKKSVEESSKAFEDEVASLQANSATTGDLISEIEALASKENLSAAEKELLRAKIDRLNETMGETVIQYAGNASALRENIALGKQHVTTLSKQAEAAVKMKRAIEISEELQKTTALMDEQQKQIEELTAARDAYLENRTVNRIGAIDYNNQINELTKSYEEQKNIAAGLQTQLDSLDTQYAKSVVAAEEAADAAAMSQENLQALADQYGTTVEAIQAATDGTAKSLDEWTEAQDEALAKQEEDLASYTELATSMFDKIDTKIKITAQNMIDNLKANQKALADWATNIETLGERGVADGLLEYLKNLGPEGAAYVAALVNATDEQLAELSALFEQGGQAAVDALNTVAGSGEGAAAGAAVVDDTAAGVAANPALEQAATDSVWNAQKAMKDTVYYANFPGIGRSIIQGVQQGVINNKSLLINSVVEAATEAYEAAKNALEIHSPSRLFGRLGRPMMQGWGNSVADNADEAINPVTRVAKLMYQAAQAGSLVQGMQYAVAANNARLTTLIGSNLSPQLAAEPIDSGNGPIGGDTINIYGDVQDPDVIAREMKRIKMFGLAGDTT